MKYDLTAAADEALEEAIAEKEKPETVTLVKPVSPKEAAFGAFLSALVSVLSLGGLFLGLLFRGSPFSSAVAGGEPVLRGSLFGLFMEIVRGSVRMPALAEGLRGVLPAVLYGCAVTLMGAVVLSLILTIASFFSPERADLLARANCCVMLLSYGIPLFLVSLYGAAGGGGRPDLPLLLTFCALLLPYSVYGLKKWGGRGILSLLILLLSAAATAAFCLPRGELAPLLGDALFGGAELPARIAVSAAAGISLLNVLLSVLRVGTQGGTLGLVRFGAQLVAAIALPVFAAERMEHAGLSVALLITASAAAALLSLLFGKKKRS